MEKDTPRKILDKEIAAALEVAPGTLNRWKREGLELPRWPRTLAESIAAVKGWRSRGVACGSVVK